jgi:hypothetical protein
MSQPSQNKAKLAIRPKKKISSMLDLIPVIHEKQTIHKLSLPLHSPRTVNTVTHSYDTSAVVPRLLLVKYDQIPGRCLQVSIIFLRFVV